MSIQSDALPLRLPPVDCAIIGAGPAGCSAASWAAQLGLTATVVDRAPAPCSVLAGLEFAQDWVLGHPQASLAEVGRSLAAHARRIDGLRWRLGSAATGLVRPDGHWRVTLADGGTIDATTVVLATGVRPRWNAAF